MMASQQGHDRPDLVHNQAVTIRQSGHENYNSSPAPLQTYPIVAATHHQMVVPPQYGLFPVSGTEIQLVSPRNRLTEIFVPHLQHFPSMVVTPIHGVTVISGGSQNNDHVQNPQLKSFAVNQCQPFISVPFATSGLVVPGTSTSQSSNLQIASPRVLRHIPPIGEGQASVNLSNSSRQLSIAPCDGQGPDNAVSASTSADVQAVSRMVDQGDAQSVPQFSPCSDQSTSLQSTSTTCVGATDVKLANTSSSSLVISKSSGLVVHVLPPTKLVNCESTNMNLTVPSSKQACTSNDSMQSFERLNNVRSPSSVLLHNQRTLPSCVSQHGLHNHDDAFPIETSLTPLKRPAENALKNGPVHQIQKDVMKRIQNLVKNRGRIISLAKILTANQPKNPTSDRDKNGQLTSSRSSRQTLSRKSRSPSVKVVAIVSPMDISAQKGHQRNNDDVICVSPPPVGSSNSLEAVERQADYQSMSVAHDTSISTKSTELEINKETEIICQNMSMGSDTDTAKSVELELDMEKLIVAPSLSITSDIGNASNSITLLSDTEKEFSCQNSSMDELDTEMEKETVSSDISVHSVKTDNSKTTELELDISAHQKKDEHKQQQPCQITSQLNLHIEQVEDSDCPSVSHTPIVKYSLKTLRGLVHTLEVEGEKKRDESKQVPNLMDELLSLYWGGRPSDFNVAQKGPIKDILHEARKWQVPQDTVVFCGMECDDLCIAKDTLDIVSESAEHSTEGTNETCSVNTKEKYGVYEKDCTLNHSGPHQLLPLPESKENNDGINIQKHILHNKSPVKVKSLKHSNISNSFNDKLHGKDPQSLVKPCLPEQYNTVNDNTETVTHHMESVTLHTESQLIYENKTKEVHSDLALTSKLDEDHPITPEDFPVKIVAPLSPEKLAFVDFINSPELIPLEENATPAVTASEKSNDCVSTFQIQVLASEEVEDLIKQFNDGSQLPSTQSLQTPLTQEQCTSSLQVLSSVEVEELGKLFNESCEQMSPPHKDDGDTRGTHPECSQMSSSHTETQSFLPNSMTPEPPASHQENTLEPERSLASPVNQANRCRSIPLKGEQGKSKGGTTAFMKKCLKSYLNEQGKYIKGQSDIGYNELSPLGKPYSSPNRKWFRIKLKPPSSKRSRGVKKPVSQSKGKEVKGIHSPSTDPSVSSNQSGGFATICNTEKTQETKVVTQHASVQLSLKRKPMENETQGRTKKPAKHKNNGLCFPTPKTTIEVPKRWQNGAAGVANNNLQFKLYGSSAVETQKGCLSPQPVSNQTAPLSSFVYPPLKASAKDKVMEQWKSAFVFTKTK